MSLSKVRIMLFAAIIVAMALAVACGGSPTPTSVPPTKVPATPTSVPPTKVPASPTTASIAPTIVSAAATLVPATATKSPATSAPATAVPATAVPATATKPPATSVPATAVPPTQAAAATKAPAAAGPTPTSGAPSGQTKVDLNKLFPPPADMRDMVLNTCQNCHTFVPIVILQFDKGQWEQNKDHHSAYVTNISVAQRDAIYKYLEANFNPDHPVPELPAELLATWTSY